tara:strand:- start:200 stop:595 length:396 start_codon:yes stop_codon:yes gene_type:complete
LKLLIDNNLPPSMGRGLGELFRKQHEIIHIKDKFGTGSLPDEQWIKELGKEGNWSVLSGDMRIAKKKPSRQVFLNNNLVGFFPAPSIMKLEFTKKVARVLYLWEVIEQQSKLVDRGCFELPMRSTTLRQIA